MEFFLQKNNRTYTIIRDFRVTKKVFQSENPPDISLHKNDQSCNFSLTKYTKQTVLEKHVKFGSEVRQNWNMKIYPSYNSEPTHHIAQIKDQQFNWETIISATHWKTWKFLKTIYICKYASSHGRIFKNVILGRPSYLL